MIKIDWSGRSHNFSKKEIHYLSNVIRNADPLTSGNETKYLRKIGKILKNKSSICVK